MAELECRVVKLPLPIRQLHPNARIHYRAKSTYTRDHRARAKLICEAMNPDKPEWECCVVRPVFHFEKKRGRDIDGMVSSLKAYMDGINDAGLFKDDKYLQWLPPLHDIDKENPHVELRFYHGTLKPIPDNELIEPK